MKPGIRLAYLVALVVFLVLVQPVPGLAIEDRPACWVLTKNRLQAISVRGDDLHVEQVAHVALSHTVGHNRAMCAAPDGLSAFVAEGMKDRLVAFDQNGQQLWQRQAKRCTAVDVARSGQVYAIVGDTKGASRSMVMCVDGSTGDVLGSVDLNQRYFDIVVDDLHTNVWVVGQAITLLDMDLRERFTIDPIEQIAVSVDYASDGTAWIAEQRYRDRKGEDRVLQVDRAGTIRQMLPLGFPPMSLAVNQSMNELWVCGGRGEFERYNLTGTGAPAETVMGSVYVDAAPDGTWWKATTYGQVVRMGAYGEQSLPGFLTSSVCLSVPKGKPAEPTSPMAFVRAANGAPGNGSKDPVLETLREEAANAPAALQQLALRQERDLAALRVEGKPGLDHEASSGLVRWRGHVLKHFYELCQNRMSPAVYRCELYHLWRRHEGILRHRTAPDVREEVNRVDELVRELFAESREISNPSRAGKDGPLGKAIAINQGEIQSIHILYSRVDMHASHDRSYMVRRVGRKYQTEDNRKVSARKVRALSGAFTELVPVSEPLRSTGGMDDDGPSYRLTIGFTDGTSVSLETTSNSSGNIPWNVRWENRLYAQFGTRLDNAVRGVLLEIDSELVPADPDPRLSRSSRLEVRIPLPDPDWSSTSNPARRSRLERTLGFLQADPVMAPYLANFDIVNLRTAYRVNRAGPGSASIYMRLSLVDRTLRVFHRISLVVKGKAMTIDGPSESAMRSASDWLGKESGLRIALADHPGMFLTLRWPGKKARLPWRFWPPGTAKSDSSVYLVCHYSPSVTVDYSYLPDRRQLWIESLRLDPDNAERFLDIRSLTGVFEDPTGATDPIDSLWDINVQHGSVIVATFDPSFLPSHPEYLASLKQVYKKVSGVNDGVRIEGNVFQLDDSGRCIERRKGSARRRKGSARTL